MPSTEMQERDDTVKKAEEKKEDPKKNDEHDDDDEDGEDLAKKTNEGKKEHLDHKNAREPTRADQIKADLRRMLAECFGTFAITWASGLGPILTNEVNNEGILVPLLMMGLSMGFTLTFLVYSIGQISGCHVNPAVTLAFALRGHFKWWRVPLYWISQLAGAFIAGGFNYAIFTNARVNAGATTPGAVSDGGALGIEIIISFFFIFAILSVAERGSVVGTQAALAVGAALSAMAIFAGPFSGASLNPARSLGPAIIVLGAPIRKIWIYIVGPFVGCLLAVGLTYVFNTNQNPEAAKAATGTGDAKDQDNMGTKGENQRKANQSG